MAKTLFFATKECHLRMIDMATDIITTIAGTSCDQDLTPRIPTPTIQVIFLKMVVMVSLP